MALTLLASPSPHEFLYLQDTPNTPSTIMWESDTHHGTPDLPWELPVQGRVLHPSENTRNRGDDNIYTYVDAYIRQQEP